MTIYICQEDYDALYDNAVHSVICGVSILLTCGTHFHDRIISLRGEVCAYKTS